jgi:carbon monoxide dehydrogenase subunit G
VRISETFEIEVEIDSVYFEVNDPERIGSCVAGVKEVVALNADESRWKIEARAGFMARTFKLNGRIVERRPPSFIAFAGEGQDVSLTGQVTLTPLGPSRTRCETVIDAIVTGPLAPLVDLMAKGPQEALIQETIANLRRRLEEGTPATSGVTGAEARRVPDSTEQTMLPVASKPSPSICTAGVVVVIASGTVVVVLALQRLLRWFKRSGHVD